MGVFGGYCLSFLSSSKARSDKHSPCPPRGTFFFSLAFLPELAPKRGLVFAGGLRTDFARRSARLVGARGSDRKEAAAALGQLAPGHAFLSPVASGPSLDFILSAATLQRHL